jgi:hypothetical protein
LIIFFLAICYLSDKLLASKVFVPAMNPAGTAARASLTIDLAT